MQKWEYAEFTWTRSRTRALPDQDAVDDAWGAVEFSGAQETIQVDSKDFWATIHTLGQDGWEMVGTAVETDTRAEGSTSTYSYYSYVFKRPLS
jgi:hypothetical protein